MPATTSGPARNRVTPFGRIVAVDARGAWTGNRGCLHDDRGVRDIVRTHRGRRWITCALSFRGRRLQQWQPGRYTPLFFLDEAVALAAGHRPCAECRRADFNAYRAAWARSDEGDRPSADRMDARLHAERTPDGAGRRALPVMPWPDIPHGTFVLVTDGPSLVTDDSVVGWDNDRCCYGERRRRPVRGTASVITPASSVNVLRVGYRPQIDAAAAGR